MGQCTSKCCGRQNCGSLTVTGHGSFSFTSKSVICTSKPVTSAVKSPSHNSTTNQQSSLCTPIPRMHPLEIYPALHSWQNQIIHEVCLIWMTFVIIQIQPMLKLFIRSGIALKCPLGMLARVLFQNQENCTIVCVRLHLWRIMVSKPQLFYSFRNQVLLLRPRITFIVWNVI